MSAGKVLLGLAIAGGAGFAIYKLWDRYGKKVPDKSTVIPPSQPTQQNPNIPVDSMIPENVGFHNPVIQPLFTAGAKVYAEDIGITSANVYNFPKNDTSYLEGAFTTTGRGFSEIGTFVSTVPGTDFVKIKLSNFNITKKVPKLNPATHTYMPVDETKTLDGEYFIDKSNVKTKPV